MIQVSVLYPYQENVPFDWTYYLDTHMPLVSQKLGSALKGLSVEQCLSGGAPGSSPSYVAVAQLRFDSVAAFQTSFGPHAEEIMGDIPNYTTITPIVQISELRLFS